METFYHITPINEDPHHRLYPHASQSWRRHRAAKAGGKPLVPARKARSRCIAACVPTAFLCAFFQPFSWTETQNAAENFCLVIGSLFSKDKDASLIATYTAVNEAVCKYKHGTRHSYAENCATLRLCHSTNSVAMVLGCWPEIAGSISAVVVAFRWMQNDGGPCTMQC